MTARLWTVEELAERWHCNKDTVCRLLVSGKLKGFKPGKNWLVTEEAVARYEGGDTND